MNTHEHRSASNRHDEARVEGRGETVRAAHPGRPHSRGSEGPVYKSILPEVSFRWGRSQNKLCRCSLCHIVDQSGVVMTMLTVEFPNSQHGGALSNAYSAPRKRTRPIPRSTAITAPQQRRTGQKTALTTVATICCPDHYLAHKHATRYVNRPSHDPYPVAIASDNDRPWHGSVVRTGSRLNKGLFQTAAQRRTGHRYWSAGPE